MTGYQTIVDYLDKGKNITGAHYASLFGRCKIELQEKRPQLTHKKAFFQHDNVLACDCEIDWSFNVVRHPRYSPDLAALYHLLPNTY